MFRFPSNNSSLTKEQLLWPATQTLIAGVTAGAVTIGEVASGLPARWFTAATLAAGAVTIAVVEKLRRQHARALAAVTAGEREIGRLTTEFEVQRDELLRGRDAEWRDFTANRSSALQEMLTHLVNERLPAALARTEVPAAVTPQLVSGEIAALAEQVIEVVTQASGEVWERLEAGELAVAAVARKVQVSAHRIQEAATRTADQHPADAAVLAGSMRVDHAAQQQARLAQSLAVLCGQWPGQQWPEPLRLVEVVRAAAGRITAYERVEVMGDQDAAVAARAAEALIHVIAELLANAAESSPPAAPVQVMVRQVQRGAVIEIDDHGVGLDEHRLEHANEIASGQHEVRLDDLGEIPEMGLAVVGAHVRRHGFKVELKETVYGGIRAVTRVPPELTETLPSATGAALLGASGSLTGQLEVGDAAAITPLHLPESPAQEPVAGARGSQPGTESGAQARETGAESAEPGGTTGGVGLPQRRSPRRDGPRSKRPTADGPPVIADAAATRPPEQAAAWADAYFSASRTGENDSALDGPGTDEEAS